MTACQPAEDHRATPITDARANVSSDSQGNGPMENTLSSTEFSAPEASGDKM